MMRSLSLTKAQADSLARSLQDAGYISVERKMYTRYSSLIRGDSVFLHHSLGVIRCRLNTVANGIIESIFG